MKPSSSDASRVTHHCRNVQLVVFQDVAIFHFQSHFGQSHWSTEVEEGSQAMVCKVLGGRTEEEDWEDEAEEEEEEEDKVVEEGEEKEVEEKEEGGGGVE